MTNAAAPTPAARPADAGLDAGGAPVGAMLEVAERIVRASGRFELLRVLAPMTYPAQPEVEREDETIIVVLAATPQIAPRQIAGVRLGVSDAQVRFLAHCRIPLADDSGPAEGDLRTVCAGAHMVAAADAGRLRPMLSSYEDAFRGLPWTCASTDVPWAEHGSETSALRHLARRLGASYPEDDALRAAEALVHVLCQAQPGAGHQPTPVLSLMDRAARSSQILIAPGTPFAFKNDLGARGWQWNDGKDLQRLNIVAFSSPELEGDAAVLDELEWLRQTCFLHSKTASVLIARIDGTQRFHPAARTLTVQQAVKTNLLASINKYRNVVGRDRSDDAPDGPRSAPRH
jgi:hypothetical protein